MELKTEGRRTYILGNTYPIKDQLRAAGCKWDSDRRAWWTGKRETAEELIAKLGTAAAAPTVSPTPARFPNNNGSLRAVVPRDGMDSVVAGRCEYKGKTYYLAGRTERGRTRYDDSVSPIHTQDGAKILLYFRDGSNQFWAARSEVRVTKTYTKPQSIQGLKDFVAREKRETEDTGIDCWMCRREEERGNLRMHLHDGCEVCGAEG